jgi:hypothetical protein
MNRTGYIALMGEEKCIQVFCEKQKKSKNLEDTDVEGRIILWVLEK